MSLSKGYNTHVIRKILLTRDPRLRQKSKPVTKVDKKILKILEDMKDTLKVQKDPEGVGLAAPQIGEFYQIFLMQDKKHVIPIFNPKIIKLSKKTNDPSTRKTRSGQVQNDEYIMEGCLSLPHYYGPVQRAWSVKLEYQTPKMVDGKWQLENRYEVIEGFLAQIMQHEIDHLNGTVFIDKLFVQNRQLFQLVKGKWQEVDLP